MVSQVMSLAVQYRQLSDRIDKITFPADTKSTLVAVLTSARSEQAGMADSGVAGYSAGGLDTARISGIDKITFSARQNYAGCHFDCSNRTTPGGMADRCCRIFWWWKTTYLSRIDKIAFPADTKSTLSATLTTGRDSTPAGWLIVVCSNA
jgi:hypothetical protein